MTPHPAIAQTQHWVENTVIGLGLCPFAAKPVATGRVAYFVCDATATDDIYRCFVQALERFLLADPAKQETALVLVPEGLATFTAYLEMLAWLEDAIASADLAGVVQLASFHPDYCFDGADMEDPANYTNRSPVPMFHLIREELLEQALADFPSVEQIPAQNVERLRALGIERLRARLADACHR